MALTKNAKISAAGLAVVVIAAVLFFVKKGDVDTPVVLKAGKAQCVVTKEETVRIKKDKQLSWSIENGCNEFVTVGNFRKIQASNATDCLQPTEGGALWPFQDKDALSNRQNKKKISLKIKKKGDLPDEELTYYFDICTGVNAESKSDPLLVIER